MVKSWLIKSKLYKKSVAVALAVALAGSISLTSSYKDNFDFHLATILNSQPAIYLVVSDGGATSPPPGSH